MVHICRSQVLKVCVVRVIYVYHIYVCMCVYVTLIWTVEMKEDLVTCATYSCNIDVTANWILTAEISQRKTTKHNKVVEHMQLSLDENFLFTNTVPTTHVSFACMCVFIGQVNLVCFRRLEMFLGKFVIRKFDFQIAHLIDLSSRLLRWNMSRWLILTIRYQIIMNWLHNRIKGEYRDQSK